VAKWDDTVFRNCYGTWELSLPLCRLRSLCRVICNSSFIRYWSSVLYVYCGGIRCTTKLFPYLPYIDLMELCCVVMRFGMLGYLFISVLVYTAVI
jgi:hypothetical protein